jgi:Ca-activated chloride channel family protein
MTEREQPMQMRTQMDLDIVAVEQDDEVTVMLELGAPVDNQGDQRAPVTVQVVLDRSGSMAGERLETAKQALIALVDRLGSADRFGVVAFDQDVSVPVPASVLSDKDATRAAIAAIWPGGQTNLSAGLLRGLQEAKRVATGTGATVLLLSDGHANAGEVDPVRLGGLAAAARKAMITTSSVGLGLGYDELLLAELAKGGQGNHVFAEEADGAAHAVASEVDGLLSKTVQAASLRITLKPPVSALQVWNDVPSYAVDGDIVLELGDLWSGEQRKLLLTLQVPAASELGLHQIADLELRYVTVPELVEHTVVLPVHVNVVPGDQAAGRIANPAVTSERLFQQAQKAKRRAADFLRNGDEAAATAVYGAAAEDLAVHLEANPSPELAQELDIVSELRARTEAGQSEWAARTSRAEQARKSRMRGR